MPVNLTRLIPSPNSSDRVVIQDTDFSTDVLGSGGARFVPYFGFSQSFADRVEPGTADCSLNRASISKCRGDPRIRSLGNGWLGGLANGRPAADQGYEIQIDNTGFNPDTGGFNDPFHQTGAIYTLAPSSGPMPAVGVWHTYGIEAIGPKITVRLDGQQVSLLIKKQLSAIMVPSRIAVPQTRPSSV